MLLAPPVFFFAALAVLLTAGHPASAREWFWVAASATLAVVWAMSATATLASGVTAAAGVTGAGILLALGLATDWTAFRRVLVATLAGVGGAAAWAAALGRSWAEVQDSFAGGLSSLFAVQADALAARGAEQALVEQLRAIGASSARLAPYFAALLVLGGVAGLVLALRWQEQLGGRTLGRGPGPFRSFRFSDQVIWVLVAGMAVVLLPPASGGLLGVSLRGWAANLVVVVSVCYLLRGLAVYQTAAARVPRLVSGVLAVVAILFWPLATTGLALLGLADSWVDFRRRLGAPQPEDGTDDGSDPER